LRQFGSLLSQTMANNSSQAPPKAGFGPLLLCAPRDCPATLIDAIRQAWEAEGLACVTCTFESFHASMNGDARWRAAVILALDVSAASEAGVPTILAIRKQCHTAFTIFFGPAASEDAELRLRLFAAGAQMVTDHVPHLREALRRVALLGRGGGDFACPSCGLSGMTEDELHLHHPLYHTCEPNTNCTCPICGESSSTTRQANFAVHLHNSHGPHEEREPPPAPYAAFAWTVCRRKDGCFLLVNEPAGISRGAPRYWLPAGRVDVGESLLQAACRETLEEGGVEVHVTGVLRFMCSHFDGYHPCPRIIFLAEPVDEECVVPKSIPDWESAGSLWVQAKAVLSLDDDFFRSPDPVELFPAVESGALCSYPVDTPAFRNFDELLVQFTDGSGPKYGKKDQLRKAWNELRSCYPSEIFFEH